MAITKRTRVGLDVIRYENCHKAIYNLVEKAHASVNPPSAPSTIIKHTMTLDLGSKLLLVQRAALRRTISIWSIIAFIMGPKWEAYSSWKWTKVLSRLDVAFFAMSLMCLFQ